MISTSAFHVDNFPPSREAGSPTNDIVFVSPKSKKAKNRFANLMNNQPECFVESAKHDCFFLRSINGKNFFWVNINNDPNWNVEF